MTEWNAAAYSRVSELQRWLADKSLATLTLRGDERVLDVGCGDGRITAAIAARLPRGTVIGTDASHDMVDFGARTFPPSDHPNLSFQAADATQLAFRGAFDLVVSFNCLHWVRDQNAALRGIASALAASGRAHLRMVARGERRSLEAVIDDTREQPQWSSHFAGYESPYLHLTPDEYRQRAEQSGLRVEGIDLQQESWDFGSRDAFVHFAEATFVEWTRKLPPESRQRFIDDVLDRYAAGNVFTFYQMEATLKKH